MWFRDFVGNAHCIISHIEVGAFSAFGGGLGMY